MIKNSVVLTSAISHLGTKMTRKRTTRNPSPSLKEQINDLVQKAVMRQYEKIGGPGLRPEPAKDSFNILDPNEGCKKISKFNPQQFGQIQYGQMKDRPRAVQYIP